jgi:hypothetical protein
MRRNYLIDKPTQYRLIGQLLLGFFVIGAANALGIYLFFGGGPNSTPGAIEMRDTLMRAILGFFVVVSFLIVMLGVILTHRFVGPGYVLRLAVEGMLEGDYARRLTLRKGDYMQDLAAKMAELREKWLGREQEVAKTVAEVQRCLDAKDLDRARELLSSVAAGSTWTPPAPAALPVARERVQV